MATTILNAGHLTDAQARNLIIKSLRTVRQYYRRADTIGETVEREVDRLIKRKTRINSASLNTLAARYEQYLKAAEAIQKPLSDAFTGASLF